MRGQIAIQDKKKSPVATFPRDLKNVPEVRMEAKKWAAQHQEIAKKELELVITSILHDPSSLYKCIGGVLLDYMPKQRARLDPKIYERWLDLTRGWAEIDSICYGHFSADEMLDRFQHWERLIKKLSKSDNINKRRASIVLLTKPVKQSQDKRLRALAFFVIDALKDEKAILITKAISWLLRNLIQSNPKEVETYLSLNKNQLPKIAIRETQNKLRSGRKSGIGLS
jgi:3-methyladenine DNA glycosylase AlkD